MYCSKYLFRSGSGKRTFNSEHYFKSSKEMRIFGYLPEAYDNTLEIAVRCTFRPIKREPMQNFAANEIEELKKQAEEHRIELNQCLSDDYDVYKKRLNYELEIIEDGFSRLLFNCCRFFSGQKNKIPVGPGRGSGAGSLVAFVLLLQT